MQALRHFLLAVQFFSRIPVTGRLAAWVGWSPELQRASAAHLPGVGWLVGLLALAVVVIGGGAGWYFKIYRPKKQQAAESEADYGGEYDGAEDYDETDPEDDGPPWDEDGEE